MARSLVEPDRCARIKKRAYLPNVDEYRSSSQSLTGEPPITSLQGNHQLFDPGNSGKVFGINSSDVALQDILAVTSSKSKTLKHGYIADLTREGGISPCSLMLGLLYVQRLSHANPKYLKRVSSRDLFLVAMASWLELFNIASDSNLASCLISHKTLSACLSVIASKYMNDEGESEALTNSDWAQIGCKPKVLLDSQELDFLDALDWRLYVSMEEYYSFVTGIEGRIALSQAMVRGWLTYTDMAAIWEASDVQETMMEASVQAGKVTFTGAAMYLVCIATLFAACHSVHVVSETWGAANAGVSVSSSFSGSDSGALFQDAMCQPLIESGNASYLLPSGLDAVFRGSRWHHDHTEARSWLKALQQPQEHHTCGHTLRDCGGGFSCGIAARTCLTDYRDLSWICDGCRNRNRSLGTKREVEQNCGHASTETVSEGLAHDPGALGRGPCLDRSNHCCSEQAKKLDINGTCRPLLNSTATQHSNLTFPFSSNISSWNLSASLQLFFAVLGLLFLGLGKPHAAVLREILVSVQ